MKLIERNDRGFTFLIGKRERELLAALLSRYPVLKSTHFRSRGAATRGEPDEHQALLEEALAEQQRENRRHLQDMLNQPGRFKENDFGFAFTLNASELEWMLQILNDIRVGSWVQLGEPDAGSARQTTELNEENVQLAWAMEMAGLFQHSILEAAKS